MIWIGTSGFQYPEWKGSFYPATLSTAKMLSFYANEFPTTEINYSFRRIPSAKTLGAWAAATPSTFRFSLKAPQEITHFKKLRDCGEVLGRFSGPLGILEEKCGPILFQLPPFHPKDFPLLRDFLATVPQGLKCAFEFRHASWFDDEIFTLLESHNVALCIAESEKLASPVAFTADFRYFRLRREDYTGKDIRRWSEIISKSQSRFKDTYVYFKHEETGVGPKFAKQLRVELEKSR